jgi:hypothetical protein
LKPYHAGESGAMALTSKLSSKLTSRAYWFVHPAYPVAVLMLAYLSPAPARADFFDGARRTFQTDIPHFFQDDIPCAFGGQPTSHTKTSCKSANQPAKPVTGKDRDRTVVPSDKTHDVQGAPPSPPRY